MNASHTRFQLLLMGTSIAVLYYYLISSLLNRKGMHESLASICKEIPMQFASEDFYENYRMLANYRYPVTSLRGSETDFILSLAAKHLTIMHV